MSKKEENKSIWDQWDGEYIGNIWGWKNSYIGLALIVAMVSLMVYRHATIEHVPEQQEVPQILENDTIGTNIEGRE